MKPKNFPAKTLMRQLISKGENIEDPKNVKLIEAARLIRTKKFRGKVV